ncbi:CPBP family intramembrane glutamic endopeptidase [Listeria aquatica]|uniref:Putative CAAX amino terminal protease family membrane protein n=1 Tax=Listeria aquatica FSL S10-1188 TaxID=1265818 RepID=W7BED3_9LIST|nr:CPBP family intramembrane glutamic endopeptidase [Listeria aquatica]EUJ21486.1 putative CAAX amino terminal protease family membrane protein [Listeria aquatica FSL S10-1188]
MVLYFILEFVGEILAMIPPIIQGLNADKSLDSIINGLQMNWYMNLTQAFALIILLFLLQISNMKLFSFRAFSRKTWLSFIVISLGTLVISNLLEILITYLNPSFNTANQAGIEDMVSSASPLVVFVAVVILAPIAEEVVFRGLIMKIIFRKYPKIGFLVSALLFTFAHIPTDILSFLLYFVMAVGLCLVYYRTKRIEASILLHFINNLIGYFFIV